MLVSAVSLLAKLAQVCTQLVPDLSETISMLTSVYISKHISDWNNCPEHSLKSEQQVGKSEKMYGAFKWAEKSEFLMSQSEISPEAPPELWFLTRKVELITPSPTSESKMAAPCINGCESCRKYCLFSNSVSLTQLLLSTGIANND